MFEIKVVRERRQGYGPLRQVRDAKAVYEAFRAHFDPVDREQFLAVILNGRNQILGFNLIALGTLTSALVHPREVYKAAILANAAAIIVVHNHPSGDPEPSDEDKALTRRLKDAGEILGIRILDHVVIGDGRYVSLAEQGVL